MHASAVLVCPAAVLVDGAAYISNKQHKELDVDIPTARLWMAKLSLGGD